MARHRSGDLRVRVIRAEEAGAVRAASDVDLPSPHGHRKTTLVVGLRRYGPIAPMAIDGATTFDERAHSPAGQRNGRAFTACAEVILAFSPSPGDGVVSDGPPGERQSCPGRRAGRRCQTSSGTMSIAPQGHSAAQMPQPLQ